MSATSSRSENTATLNTTTSTTSAKTVEEYCQPPSAMFAVSPEPPQEGQAQEGQEEQENNITAGATSTPAPTTTIVHPPASTTTPLNHPTTSPPALPITASTHSMPTTTQTTTATTTTTTTTAPPPNPFIFKLHGGPETLRRVLLSQGWIEWSSDFHLENQYNLMWRSGHFRLSEMLSACSLQRVNHFSKSGIITNKGKLLRAHRKARLVFGKTYEFVPNSYLLPTEYTKFVKTFSEQDEKKIWICKPDNSACGRKIFLIRDLSDLKYDQQVVVQSYIERPLTIGGYKVDLRLYVLVKSFRPLEAYLYRDGLARFGKVFCRGCCFFVLGDL